MTDVQWRKATRSSDNGGHCVEVARVGRLVVVRDSKDPDGPKLLVERTDLQDFLAVLKRI